MMPAAHAASIPFLPSVFGTVTDLAFLMMLPLTRTRALSTDSPSMRRASAAAYAIAIGSVQPIAGRSCSFKMVTNA